LASSLAKSGLVIVSGLAHGVDSAAHQACQDRTIAVLGQGIECARKGNKANAIEAIVQAGGLVISEFPPYQHPSRHTFPQRNRVIAGLSIATAVIEATMRSGSRITARHALEYGREVMAVPGHPFDNTSVGCNALIREGALLIQNAQDMLTALGIQPEQQAKTSPESAIAKQIMLALGTGLTFDELLEKTGLPIPTLLMSIESLELTGWVQRLPGDRICARNPS